MSAATSGRNNHGGGGHGGGGHGGYHGPTKTKTIIIKGTPIDLYVLKFNKSHGI